MADCPVSVPAYHLEEVPNPIIIKLSELLDIKPHTRYPGWMHLASLFLEDEFFDFVEECDTPAGMVQTNAMKLFQRLRKKGITLDILHKGLVSINHAAADFITTHLSSIDEYVQNNRRSHQSSACDDPQQNTDSSPSVGRARIQAIIKESVLHFSNVTSGEESSDYEANFQPRKRIKLAKRHDRQALRPVVFVTGGTCSLEMNYIKKQLGDLETLGFNIKWDQECGEPNEWKWQKTFNSAVHVIVALTQTYVSSVKGNSGCPDRAKLINRNIQRELIQHGHHNKRFTSILLSKTNVKKSDLPAELDICLYKWPDCKQTALNHLERVLKDVLR